MSDLYIPVILGTARAGRQSEHAAHFVCERVRELGVETELVDPRDFLKRAITTPSWEKSAESEEMLPWRERAEKADAFVIIIPEYNHGYPGELKLLLDSAYKEYKGKPVLLGGVSAGGWGGTRVVDHIEPVLVELSMVPLRTALYFPKVGDAFDDESNPTDEKAAGRVDEAVQELAGHARHWKKVREGGSV